LLFHSPRSVNIFNPEVIEDDVRDLNHLHTIDAFEDREEQRNLPHHQEFLLRTNDIYSIANIKWVFDEEENIGGEEFLGCSSENKRQESRVVPAVASVVTKLVSWKATAEC
jgi:hypothetical protein